MEEDFFFFLKKWDLNLRDTWTRGIIELNCEDENLDNVAKN